MGMRNTEHSFEGVLVVDKETGPTSHDVIARLRRLLSMRRIGHCGTLDPLATGVLVVCLGKYTRLNEWLTEGEKEYLATFRLGGTSDTGDAQGEITSSGVDASLPLRGEIEKEIKTFEGAGSSRIFGGESRRRAQLCSGAAARGSLSSSPESVYRPDPIAPLRVPAFAPAHRLFKGDLYPFPGGRFGNTPWVWCLRAATATHASGKFTCGRCVDPG